MVAAGVGRGFLSGLVEGSDSPLPGRRFLGCPSRGSMGAWGPAPAADAAVGDALLVEVFAEAATGGLGSVVGVESELAGSDLLSRERGLGAGNRFLGAGSEVGRPSGDLAGAAAADRMQAHPAVPGWPEFGHVDLPVQAVDNTPPGSRSLWGATANARRGDGWDARGTVSWGSVSRSDRL